MTTRTETSLPAPCGPADRAAARANWPVRARRLGDHDTTILQDTTPEERIGTRWQPVVEARAVAGTPIPDCERPRRQRLPSAVLLLALRRQPTAA